MLETQQNEVKNLKRVLIRPKLQARVGRLALGGVFGLLRIRLKRRVFLLGLVLTTGRGPRSIRHRHACAPGFHGNNALAQRTRFDGPEIRGQITQSS